jgi:uncharacterized protein YccT (UPF0319 family)
MKAGDYASVRAAAKAAGIVKEPTRLQRLQRLWRQASPAERAAFEAWKQTQNGWGGGEHGS